MIRITIVTLLSAVLFTGCADRAKPGVLITAREAQNVRSYGLQGMEVLEYMVREKYPAKELIEDFSRRLIAKGWKPLNYTFLSPKYKSSHVTGWTIFHDPPRDPSQVIYEWSGDWQDNNGNIVTYTFRYHDPIKKYRQSVFMLRPGNSNLYITAIFMPQLVARTRQAQLNPKS